MYTVGNLKDSLSGLLTGTNLNNVTDLYGAIQRAARVFGQRANIPASQGREAVTIYDGVYDYLAPTSIFGSSITDLRPQARDVNDFVYKQYANDFDRNKSMLPSGSAVTFEYDHGIQIMRVTSARSKIRTTLDPMTQATGWVAAGSASGLVADSSIYYTSPSSLRFLLTGASTGTLTKTLTSTLDLTAVQGLGVVFLAIDTPSVTNLSSIELRIGSSASKYYSVTATAAFLGAWPANKFTLVAFALATATTVGVPVITAMNYLQVRITHAATLTNFRVGSLFVSLPSQYEVLYESAALFMASGQNPATTITDDNDSLLLAEDAYTIFQYESAVSVAQQSGSASGGQVAEFNNVLNGVRARNGAVIQMGLYDLYRAANPSDNLKVVGSYL